MAEDGATSMKDGQPETILVAVAWPYASGPRHLGHVAGFGVPSDVFARFQRLKGNHVLMVSGTDEHGTPIMISAEREGLTPRAVADRYNQMIVEDLRRLGLSYDIFTRTTTHNHYHVVQDVFATLHRKGYIIKRSALGAFSSKTGQTLPDRYIEGTCPICGYAAARGDQCENCGNQLDPVDLIEPRSRVDGSPPVFRETEHFFLDLPAFQDGLAKWVSGHENWRPNVRAFSLNLIANLKPRAITRDLDWGVPIPLEGYAERPDKRIYVWFDAVIGYLSASLEWAERRGTPESWRDWWQDPAARHFYFMGKDNIVFHSVIWPSILMGYGSGGEIGGGRRPLELPYDIVSSEFLTMEGRKFSSSRGIAIYVNDFLSRYDPDPLRYYLIAAGPESRDTDFTWAEFVRRNNDELVGNWGNLAHRTLTNVYRTFGHVPQPGILSAPDLALIHNVEGGFDSVGGHLAAARFKAALGEAMRLVSLVNQYLGEMEPWRLIGTAPERSATTFYVALRCVNNLKVLMTPFLPFSSQKLHELLGYAGQISPQPIVREYGSDESIHRVLSGEYSTNVGWAPIDLPIGQAIPPPEPLFRRLDKSVVDEELNRMKGSGS
jgi:methionyl-tRNA synthetase